MKMLKMIKYVIKTTIIILIIYKKKCAYKAAGHSRVAIFTFCEDVSTGGEEETDKPEVPSLPSSSS